MMMQYFFTKFGDVYLGCQWFESKYPDYTIVIQFSKINDYKALKPEDKTFEKISEYGWVLKNEVIQEVLDGDKFDPVKKIYQEGSWSGNHDYSVMFVFGAGASAHCVYGSEKAEFDNDNLRPPLGPGLFEKRFKDYYSKYKGVKQSLHFLQDDKNPDVEELFENEWKNIHLESNQEVLSRHINIQYYLQEILKEVSKSVIKKYDKNLYSNLANQIQKIYTGSIKTTFGKRSSKKFAFVSFNQDSILEYFLSEQFKIPINSIDDYVSINENPFCIFKPHGSHNWGWQFPDISKFGNNTANWLFENNINYFQLYFKLLGNYVNMINWGAWGYEAGMNKYYLGKSTIDKSKLKLIKSDNLNNYFPGLLLPYRDKDEFTMPLEHYCAMGSFINRIETLVIIGWKGNEDAFNRLLLQRGINIKKIIIADPNSEIVIKNLEPLLLKQNIKPIIFDNFEKFVLPGIEKQLD